MQTGALQVGSRTPVAGTPSWVTLEVVQGGFATGEPLAGGILRQHEKEWLERLELPPGEEPRRALHAHFLSQEGLGQLREMLRSGCYRFEVPEEGALLVVTWLLENGHAELASEVLDALAPWFDRLRFYPQPSPTPVVESSSVHRQPVKRTIGDLLAIREAPQELAQREALQLWLPLFDRIVALFVETVKGPLPTIAIGPDGRPVRQADSSWDLSGGWPCQKYPESWHRRAEALLDEYRSQRTEHRRCRRPENPRGNFAQLRAVLERCVVEPDELTGRDVGRVRMILAQVAAKRGLPGSSRCGSLRTMQAQLAAKLTKREAARIVAARLRALSDEGGVGAVAPLLTPVSGEEAAEHGVVEGQHVHQDLRRVVLRSLQAPLERLLDEKVVPSGEVLADVTPQLISRSASAGIDDPFLRRLFGALYEAFQRRRSLLLLNLERQVKFEELPWVAAVARFRTADVATRDAARQILRRVASLTLTRFPHAIVPNKLLRQFRTLVERGGLDLPLVDEVAADIFMGTFSEKYLRAAQRAGRAMKGSLYEHYYGIHYDQILEIDDAGRSWFGVATSKLFDSLCERRAGVAPREYRSVARNGKIIEQEQILTTHNLAVLVYGLDLEDELRPIARDLARGCLSWILRRLERDRGLKSIKNAAYAWRQMVFFLSLTGSEVVEELIVWADDQLTKVDANLRARFKPILNGLALAHQGGSLDRPPDELEVRRFLGWTTRYPHWLQPAAE